MDPIDSGMQLLSLLWNNPVVHEMGYMFKVGKNIELLKESVDELMIAVAEVRQRIEPATTSTDEAVPTERVNKWLGDFLQVRAKVARIDAKYTKRITCLGLGLNCWSSYRISKKAAKLTMQVNDLIAREREIGQGIERRAPAIRRMPTLTEPLLPTTETYLRRVLDQLRDDGFGMVGIWGMAGVGKTSLLQRINNDPYVSGAGFDYVIWAAASQDHHLDKVRDASQDHGHLDKLREEIARRLGLTIHEDDGAMLIYRFLNGKSFLLLLDDIWEAFDLRKLGLPYNPRSDRDNIKRKVVFTTQSETVCKKTMSYHEESDFVSCSRIKMECLEEEEAWEIFQRNVGGTVRDIIACDIRVHDYAKEMTRKCGGLPLALVIVAHAMSACETWYEWKAAATSVEMWRSNEVDLYHPLMLSFHHLPNDIMRRCFLCCGLWPSGYYIREEDLISCWMGMDLLGQRRNIDGAYLTGYGIIEFLKRASLLEDGGIGLTGKYVKMHDIIREMALLVAADERAHEDTWMVLAGSKLQQASEEDWRKAQAISLVDAGNSLEIFETEIEFNRLTTLILQLNCAVQSFPGYIFKFMPFLTFLDLSKTGIEEIPPEIGELVYLRYLNLSCYGRYALPMELASLVRLKYLIVSSNGCILKSIPRGLLSALKKLKLLDVTYSVYEGWEAEGEASMKELESRVVSLGITVLSPSQMAFLSGETSSVHLWRLRLCKLEEVGQLSLCEILCGRTQHLFELCISDCDGLGQITITDGRYDNLQYFSLNGFRGLKSIIWNRTLPGVAFQNVRFLELCGNQYLENVTWISQLSHLEYMSLRELTAMERVIDDEATEEVTSFRYLKSLILHSLPKLRSFSRGRLDFPSLESITIFNCPKLYEAPFYASYKTQR